MLHIQQRVAIESPWTSMLPLRLGKVPTGVGTPDLYVLIAEGDQPVLRVDLYREHASFQADAIEWDKSVIVGYEGMVYAIDPIERMASKTTLGSYFDCFYATEGCLLVASGTHLLRFSTPGSVLWKSPQLGLDGVIIRSVEGGLIKGEGEWDPAGEWKPFTLSLESGVLVSGYADC